MNAYERTRLTAALLSLASLGADEGMEVLEMNHTLPGGGIERREHRFKPIAAAVLPRSCTLAELESALADARAALDRVEARLRAEVRA